MSLLGQKEIKPTVLSWKNFADILLNINSNYRVIHNMVSFILKGVFVYLSFSNFVGKRTVRSHLLCTSGADFLALFQISQSYVLFLFQR